MTNLTQKTITSLVERKPFIAFLITLGILLSLIVFSNLVGGRTSPPTISEPTIKQVSVYAIGNSATIQTQAQVKKTGVVSILAQSGGVVQQIFRKEGEPVRKGGTLVWISNNYTGGTLSTIQRKQAQTNYEFNQDTVDANIHLLAQQRQIAETNRGNVEQLRQITDKSTQETSDLIRLNTDILNRVSESIKQLQLISNPSEVEKSQLTQLLSQKAQVQLALNQLNANLRSTQYQASQSNPPTQLANQQLSLTTQQLDLQIKTLELQSKLSQLGLWAAQISESLNYPAAPFAGLVERIAVVPGQVVSPGELLAIVKASTTSATLEVTLPREIATQIDLTNPSTVTIGKEKVMLSPSFISSQPTVGSLYLLTFKLPSAYVDLIDPNSFLSIEIPIGLISNNTDSLFIPLDSIFQTQDDAYVYLVKTIEDKSIAVSQPVKIGEVIGNYVEVTEGLSNGDIVILDRTVLGGDLISVK